LLFQLFYFGSLLWTFLNSVIHRIIQEIASFALHQKQTPLSISLDSFPPFSLLEMDQLPPTKIHSLGNWESGSRNTIRNHFIAMTGEFLGTFLFLFSAFGPTQIAVTTLKNEANPSVPNTSALFFIAAAFGVSVTVNVWAFYRINGGMLNPAVCFSSSCPCPFNTFHHV